MRGGVEGDGGWGLWSRRREMRVRREGAGTGPPRERASYCCNPPFNKLPFSSGLILVLSWWTFGILFIFSARGRGWGIPRSWEEGGVVGFFFAKKKSKGGGGLQEGRGVRGREGVCGEVGNFGKGGAK